MLATPEIDYYSRYTSALWRDYCHANGYAFYVETARLLPEMHVNWTKIELVRRTLSEQSHDYVLLVDADTIVANPSVTVESLIESYADKDIVFCPDSTIRFGVHFPLNLKAAFLCRALRPPNAGFILIKAGAFASLFFDEWLGGAKHGALAQWAQIHPRNQNVLWRGPFQKHRSRLGIFDREVSRVGTNAFLDRLSIHSKGAFVLHDKRLPDASNEAAVLIEHAQQACQISVT